MPKTTAHTFTLIYVEDSKPVTLEFQDLDTLALHIQTEEIHPGDDKYALLVDGKEVAWSTRVTIHMDMPQPALDVKPVKRKRRTKAELEFARANEAKKKNGAVETVTS